MRAGVKRYSNRGPLLTLTAVSLAALFLAFLMFGVSVLLGLAALGNAHASPEITIGNETASIVYTYSLAADEVDAVSGHGSLDWWRYEKQHHVLVSGESAKITLRDVHAYDLPDEQIVVVFTDWKWDLLAEYRFTKDQLFGDEIVLVVK